MLACATGLRRRIEPLNLDQGASVPLGFVFQLADKLPPADITDGFRQRVVFHHILDGQALNAHHLVFVDDACTELVLVVPPPVSDTNMDASHFETGFGSVLAALLFLSQLRAGRMAARSL